MLHGHPAGAQVWSVFFFFTLFLLGQSSSFAMIDAFITMIYDADWAKKYPRIMYVPSPTPALI